MVTNRKLSPPEADKQIQRSNAVTQRFTTQFAAPRSMTKRTWIPFFGFQGGLAACWKAANSAVQTTSPATPTQLVFGREVMFNASFQADWQFTKERKQRLISQNNECVQCRRRGGSQS